MLQDENERVPLLWKLCRCHTQMPWIALKGLNWLGLNQLITIRGGPAEGWATLSPSFSSVVAPIARRHRSTMHWRAIATTAFLRMAGLPLPVRGYSTGSHFLTTQ